MRRLTYAPKAYVFVRSRNHKNQIFNLTDYVVEGSVDRKVNDVSKATVVLRNAFLQFSPERKESFFLPMDGITIWLQRLKNQPIQVFTGYLDSVPFYQMYPGNCQLTASCTLKRLNYTYFDPTIQAVTQFFTSFGWTPDFNGGFSNPFFMTGKKDANGNELTSDAFSINGKSDDGGIGSVIKPFLMNIGGWDGNHVFVADLPPDLPKKAAKLYDTLLVENQAMLDGLEQLLKGVMSVTTDISGAAAQTVVQLGVMEPIYNTSSDKGVNPVIMTLAALLFSGLSASFLGPNGEAGLFAAPNKQKATQAATNPHQPHRAQGDSTSSPYNGKGGNYDGGRTLKQMMDPKIAVEAFAYRMIQADPDKAFAKAANKGDLLAISEWISKAAQVPVQSIAARVHNLFRTAQKFTSAYSGAVIGKNNPLLVGSAMDMLPEGLKWNDIDKMFSQDKFNDTSTWKTSYSHAIEELAPFVYVAHKNGLRLVKPPKGVEARPDIVVLRDPTPNQTNGDKSGQFWNWLKRQDVDIVHWMPTILPTDADHNSWIMEYHKGQPILAGTKEDWPQGYIIIQASKSTPYPKWTGNPDTSAKDNNATSQGSPTDPSSTTAGGIKQPTFEDIAKMGLQSAFYAQVSFPGNQFLSETLSGDKALMNDIPVMEAVKQLCGGSLRSFMSMPNGDFVAFYPDYFGGSDRKPYWAITDMEIISLGIQLSDEALATHVYVTGATQSVPGQLETMLDSVATLGVVTLQHVFADGNFISGDIKGNTSGDILGRNAEAYKFMKFYGARPLSIQQPLIRNQMFEFLYAWQMFMFMWASQFQTLCEFTFQPELLAGGRVAFPDHDLVMYVNSVHHQWSYESGFKTSAILMAPTTTTNDPNDHNFRPGMALAGNGLSGIGTAAS